MSIVPKSRIRKINQRPVSKQGQYVLYWMIANRRTQSNYSLQRAVEWANSLKKPLLIFEPLRVNYKWASDRIHRFVLQGMADQQKQLQDAPATYYPYVASEIGHDHGLIQALSEQAAVVVTDDFPCFFLPGMLRLVARRLDILLEAVDSNGLYPMHSTTRVFTTAHSFRRFLQKELRPHLLEFPDASPLERMKVTARDLIPEEVLSRWQPAPDHLLTATEDVLASIPIDHSVTPAAFDGGTIAARAVLKTFINERFEIYGEERNHPDSEAASGLSPYLHFGHISAHTIFTEIANREGWTPAYLAEKATGSRNGWWGMSETAEGFLDELITWRELGYNMCSHRNDYDRYESLPDWARQTIEDHANDPKEYQYTLEEFESAQTHDEIWNAAQQQLVQEGRMHNYLRMLWGKKIFEWSQSAKQALDTMIHLNNKYAVDGRNPNSYSGIFWVLGRYDRAWGPERPIYGKIRYMTSESTKRKLKMKEYLKKYGE